MTTPRTERLVTLPSIVAQALRPGMSLIEGNKVYHISKVHSAPRGCRFHVHVQLEDKRTWCYDYGENVEVA